MQIGVEMMSLTMLPIIVGHKSGLLTQLGKPSIDSLNNLVRHHFVNTKPS